MMRSATDGGDSGDLATSSCDLFSLACSFTTILNLFPLLYCLLKWISYLSIHIHSCHEDNLDSVALSDSNRGVETYHGERQHAKLKRSQEEEAAKSPESPPSLANLIISALFFGIPLTSPPEVVFPATSSPSLQAFMEAISWQEIALRLLKNLGSSSRSTRDRQGARQSQRSCRVRSLTRQIQTQKIR
ncbi:hypothetical protein E2C01_032940 [Portunus trituberculatus]|uniref:Uncharacterized protein n=1 Tax=Portunus trituberculatus TaxID=210409 RepID=A0A5B7F133_PORTR|nr:hypothetical protein [Portunus trituberculatus]